MPESVEMPAPVRMAMLLTPVAQAGTARWSSRSIRPSLVARRNVATWGASPRRRAPQPSTRTGAHALARRLGVTLAANNTDLRHTHANVGRAGRCRERVRGLRTLLYSAVLSLS